MPDVLTWISAFMEESAMAYLSAMISSSSRVAGSSQRSLCLRRGALSAPGSEVLDGLHLVHALAGVAQLGLAREVVAS